MVAPMPKRRAQATDCPWLPRVAEITRWTVAAAVVPGGAGRPCPRAP
jgi:hypothetical protein